MAVYLAASRPLTGRARYAMPPFGVAILLMQAGMAFGPPPPSDRAMAATALTAYTLIAASIAWLERGRTAEAGTLRS